MNSQGKEKPHQTPFVSVVVPAYNSPERTRTCIAALLKQTYPHDRYEVIVVDNGSTDSTPQVIQQYRVTLLVEDTYQSPYAARNKGIARARGEIIAMIDVNCRPVPTWLENGVSALATQSADVAGGKVTFAFPPRKTAAEIFDSISNVKMRQSIEKRGVAKGGNLFIRKHVFDAIGLFPENLRSGGDVLWTGRASRAGFKLVYAADAEVLYPARKLFPLLKKQWRVGRGQPVIWQEQGTGPVKLFLRILLGFRPPTPALVRKMLHERLQGGIRYRFVSIWLVAWACTAATNLGRAFEFLRWCLQPAERAR